MSAVVVVASVPPPHLQKCAYHQGAKLYEISYAYTGQERGTHNSTRAGDFPTPTWLSKFDSSKSNTFDAARTDVDKSNIVVINDDGVLNFMVGCRKYVDFHYLFEFVIWLSQPLL